MKITNYRKLIIQSSFIDAIGTTPKGRDLHVIMHNGSHYKYIGAGKKMVSMLTAPSAGQFLNEHLKPCHKYAKRGGGK